MQPKDRCSIEGCEKPVNCRGWCSAHYEYYRRNGTPGPAGDRRKRVRPVVLCAVGGCERRAKGYGWCSMHYRRWKVHGNPLVTKRTKPGNPAGPMRIVTRRRVRPDGYVAIFEPTHPLAHKDGYVTEHRKVAYDAGLLTDLTKHVHHKNRDRADNRLANLQVIDQPSHMRQHIREAGYVTNQFGRWSVLNGEARLERRRELGRKAARLRREKELGL